MSGTVIKVEKLGKCYRIGLKEEMSDTMVGAIGHFLRSPLERFRRLKKLSTFTDNHHESEDIIWALKDVSLEIKQGEVIGFIGSNGAGKSTLLKILAGITEPTKGRAVIKGRVASLLEVGTGFHPELTGRENIYLNGTILGMTKKEIDGKFDEIVEFSGVEKFLDTPVKRYSSGMKVRLAFAVAAHLDPEILIVDEVLAVGDAEFQKKCLGKMKSVSRAGGKTVLFVSHNMGAIRSLCTKAFLLSKGKLVFSGDAQSTISRYIDNLTGEALNPFVDNPFRIGDGSIRFNSVGIVNNKGIAINKIMAGENIGIRLEYINTGAECKPEFTITIFNFQGIPVTNLTTRILPLSPVVLSGNGTAICHVSRVPFPPGRYFAGIGIRDNGVFLDHIPKAFDFEVIGSVFYDSGKLPDTKYSTVFVNHHWEVS